VLRVALAVALAAAVSPAWCPEESLLQTIDETKLRPYLEASRDEIALLLARHRARRALNNLETIAGAVGEASRRNTIPPELVLAVIGAESSFRPDAVSHKGALGLMQLMPYTARELSLPWTDDSPLFAPQVHIPMGSLYLGKLLRSFRDLDSSLAAYNRGPSAVLLRGWPRGRGETAGFVRRVRHILAKEGALDSPRSFGSPHPAVLSGVSSL
jgi:soluble lytic murein transglycosylase-like protein